MLQTIKWFFGKPVVNRARRLAQAFLDQTLHAPAVQRQLLLDQIAPTPTASSGGTIISARSGPRTTFAARYPSAVMTATSHTSSGSGRATSRRFSARGPEF